MDINLRTQILSALVAEASGSIETARMNVEVYLHNPVGIGEHPNVMAAIQEQLDVISEHSERLDVLTKHFGT
jgi:uncharacterized protein (DUF342 family)